MKLQQIGLYLLDYLIDFFGAGVHKQRNDIHKGGYEPAQACSLFKAYRAFAGLVKNQADRIGARKHRRIDVLRAGQAANFDAGALLHTCVGRYSHLLECGARVALLIGPLIAVFLLAKAEPPGTVRVGAVNVFGAKSDGVGVYDYRIMLVMRNHAWKQHDRRDHKDRTRVVKGKSV